MAIDVRKVSENDPKSERVFPSNQPVTGRIRKSTDSPFYKNATISGTIDKDNGATFTGVMILDD